MIGMGLLIRLKGHMVGKDEQGNRYYEERFLFSKPNRPPRRWIWYKNKPDASKIPATWHGWLHFTHEEALTTTPFIWQKSHQSNPTGTGSAYHPEGSLCHVGKAKDFTRYHAWTPATDEKSL